MNILVYSMSLNAEFSSTLAGTRYIRKAFEKRGENFDEIIMSKDGSVSDSDLEKFEKADLILFATSMYHFIMASQANEALTKIFTYLKDKCPNKPVTVFMTTNYLMDTLPRQVIESMCESYGLKYIKGFNMHMDDIPDNDKMNNAYSWFESVRLVASGETLKFEEPTTVCIFAADKTPKTLEMVDAYKAEYEKRNANVKVINVLDYNIKPCLGCQYCYTERHCFMEKTDDFIKLLNETMKDVDVCLNVGEVNNGFFSPEYKCFYDRHVFMGRCPYPYDTEVVMLYAFHRGEHYVENDYRIIESWADAMGSFGGDVYLGVFEGVDEKAIQMSVAAVNAGATYYDTMYRNYVNMQFANLAQNIQNIEPLDYKCFESKGMYEPIPVNQNCRGIHSMEDAKKSCEMKSFMVRSYMSQADCTYEKKPRRVHKSEDLLENVTNPPYAKTEAKPKKGFSLFGKKG